jgi:hypothetical protein
MARLLAQRWADGVLRQAARLREVLRRAGDLDRAAERGEDEALATQRIVAMIDVAWVEQHLLMVATQQFEKWAKRMIEARGQARPEERRLLRLVRNSLEHLDEAELTEFEALPDAEGKCWSLKDLPGGRLPLGVTLRSDKVMVCDLIELDEIEANCRHLADEIFDEITRPDVESYIDWLVDDGWGR